MTKATIEERAKEYSHRNGSVFLSGYENAEREAYITGATEQQAIDIENAVDWLNANWRKFIDTDADGMIRFSGWKNDFKKAMRDETDD